MGNPKHIKIFSSFDEENQAEYERRKRMTADERMREFAIYKNANEVRDGLKNQ